jgi:hypothetical protein
MCVSAGWQVQSGIGRVQVGMALAAIGEPLHLDLPEAGAKRPLMAGFHRAAGDLVHIGHLLEAHLAAGTHLEMVLQQPAQQLTAAGVELGLKLAVGQPGRVVTVQPAHDRLEVFTRRREPLAGSGRAHRLACRRARSSARPCSAAARSCSAAAS